MKAAQRNRERIVGIPRLEFRSPKSGKLSLRKASGCPALCPSASSVEFSWRCWPILRHAVLRTAAQDEVGGLSTNHRASS